MSSPINLSHLSRSEKLRLVQQLWDDIADDPETTELSESQRSELEHRLERLRQEPQEGLSWEATVAWVRRGKGQ